MRSQFDMKLRLYGYKGLDKSQLTKKSFIETQELVRTINLPSTNGITDITINPKNIAKQSRKLITNLFPNLNRDINVLAINDYFRITMKLSNGIMSVEDYLSTLKSKSSTMDAINAPVNFIGNVSCTNGETVKPMALIDNDSYLDRLPIYVSGFNIGSINLSRLGIITHLHELTHALLERNKGSVKDYYKAELLSILVEKIAGFEIDKTSILLSKQNIFRYENLKQCLNKSNDDSTHKYFLSTILAEFLFDKYENGTETYRNYLLSQISKVLSGELVLEDMLINEGITLDNGNLPCIIEEKIQKSTRNLK